MIVLNAREAYRLWAPTYAAETAVSFLDEELAREMLAGLPCRRLLDAGCGTGRRIERIPGAIGIDASPEMIAASGASNAFVGDIRKMPFEASRFDMVWCRLVLGHLRDARSAYDELARVCAPSGHIFVTDFHADAIAAGNQRSFRDEAGRLHAVEHYVHGDHAALGADAGLTLEARRDASVGAAIRGFYVRAGRLDLYEKALGLKLVGAFLFSKPYACA